MKKRSVKKNHKKYKNERDISEKNQIGSINTRYILIIGTLGNPPFPLIKKVTKISPKFSTTGGTSDARFIKKIAPCLEFGLVNKTMHKVDECVSLIDLKKLTKIYQNILEDYFR